MYPNEVLLYHIKRTIFALVFFIVMFVIIITIIIVTFMIIYIPLAFISPGTIITYNAYISYAISTIPIIIILSLFYMGRIGYIIGKKSLNKLNRISVIGVLFELFGLEHFLELITPTPFKDMEKMSY